MCYTRVVRTPEYQNITISKGCIAPLDCRPGSDGTSQTFCCEGAECNQPDNGPFPGAFFFQSHPDPWVDCRKLHFQSTKLSACKGMTNRGRGMVNPIVECCKVNLSYQRIYDLGKSLFDQSTF